MVNLESIDRAQGRLPRARDLPAGRSRSGRRCRSTLDALPGKTYEGKVFAINPLVDAAGRAIVIRAQVKQHRHGAASRDVRPRAPDHARRSRTRWCCPSRRWCRRATSSTCSASSTARRTRAKVDIGQRRDGMVEIVDGRRRRRHRRQRRAAEAARRLAGDRRRRRQAAGRRPRAAPRRRRRQRACRGQGRGDGALRPRRTTRRPPPRRES